MTFQHKTIAQASNQTPNLLSQHGLSMQTFFTIKELAGLSIVRWLDIGSIVHYSEVSIRNRRFVLEAIELISNETLGFDETNGQILQLTKNEKQQLVQTNVHFLTLLQFVQKAKKELRLLRDSTSRFKAYETSQILNKLLTELFVKNIKVTFAEDKLWTIQLKELVLTDYPELKLIDTQNFELITKLYCVISKINENFSLTEKKFLIDRLSYYTPHGQLTEIREKIIAAYYKDSFLFPEVQNLYRRSHKYLTIYKFIRHFSPIRVGLGSIIAMLSGGVMVYSANNAKDENIYLGLTKGALAPIILAFIGFIYLTFYLCFSWFLNFFLRKNITLRDFFLMTTLEVYLLSKIEAPLLALKETYEYLQNDRNIKDLYPCSNLDMATKYLDELFKKLIINNDPLGGEIEKWLDNPNALPFPTMSSSGTHIAAYYSQLYESERKKEAAELIVRFSTTWQPPTLTNPSLNLTEVVVDNSLGLASVEVEVENKNDSLIINPTETTSLLKHGQ